MGWACQPHPAPRRGRVKSAEEIMEILEGFDLTASYRDAAELAEHGGELGGPA